MYFLAGVASAAYKRRTVLIMILAVVGAIGFSAAASAGDALSGVITSIYTNTDYGVMTIVTNGTRDLPACATTPNWVLPLTTGNNPIVAQLLTAFATQSTVSLWGDGLCNVSPGAETLVQVQIVH
jgi:hypothetical protein